MRKKSILVLSMAMALMLSACGQSATSVSEEDLKATTEVTESEEQVDEEGDVELEMKDSNLSNIATIIDSIDKDGNVVLSDLSLSMALGLTSMGTDTTSKQALEEYFGSNIATLNLHHKDLMMQYSSNQDVTLSLANSVWANQTIQFNDEYINNAVNYYEADVESLDFADENSVGVINGWCNEKTEGLIPEIVNNEMLQESDAVLINALYFNGKWAEQFAHSEVIENSDFTNVDGEIEKVTMMYGSVDTYYENDEAEAFAKYYEGGQIAFIGILPKEEGDYNVSDLKLDELLASASTQDVDIVMPKFIVEDTNDLTDSVKAAGLSNLFGPSADFSLMSDNQIAIDTVIQKTYIDVNEEGTEAAAVTSMMMKTTSAMTEDEAKFIRLDRPFTFMIYDTVNDECLFIGNIKTLK